MNGRNVLITFAVVAVALLALAYATKSTDSGSKARDTGITQRVEKVEANVDLAKGDKGDPGQDGQINLDLKFGTGKDGLACFDLNGNGVGDVEEDVNGDGEYDTLDCRSEDGAVGPQGKQGKRGKPGFGLKIRIGGRDGKSGKDGRDGQDCTTGGTCEFYSVCCTDNGKPTVTPATTPAKPEPAKKEKKKQKKDVMGEPRVRFENQHTVTVRVNGDTVQEGRSSSSEPTPAAELPSEVKNEGGTVYINNAPVNVRIGN